MKYMGKIMGNLGPLIALGMSHDRKITEAIGEKKAQRLEREFEVSDLDPIGLDTIFDK